MELDLKTFHLPSELCEKAGLAACWKPINSLAAFGYVQKHAKQPDKKSSFSPCDSPLFEVRQETILFHPVLRKLVNESSGTFINLQNLGSNKMLENKNELVKVSRQYRSVIRACLENLQEEMTKVDNECEEETMQNFVTIFYSVECIWHLCEILFVDTIPGNIVLPHLLEWIRFHFPKHERNAAIMLAGDLVGLESNTDYWPTVIGSILQGRVKVARALLKQHSASDSSVYQLADKVLKSMPLYNIHSGISVSEFDIQWQQWVADTNTKIDAQLFISDVNVDFIMKLVVGDEGAWMQMQKHSESWYELMAGSLFYTHPVVKTFELGTFAKQCLGKMSLRHRMKHLDKVLLAALEFDMLQVIREIQHFSENGWFVTHLTDLLFHSRRLHKAGEDIDDFSADKLRESFLLDYGSLFMGHRSLWQLGLTYLDRCPTEGLNVIELLLNRIPIENESKTRKVMREAQIRNLTSVEQTICKIQGMKSFKNGRLGNALTWALKSQDDVFTSYLADKFLRHYTGSGEFSNIDLLDNLGSCMLASDRLIFLGKYYEFHKLYQVRKYKEAAHLLISLMVSKIIPSYFWKVLLVEAIPLLESEEIVFTSDDTFTILHCLEERIDFDDLKDNVEVLRLAAARNLARALMLEAQGGFV